MTINLERSKEMIISFAQNDHFRSIVVVMKIDGRDIEQVGCQTFMCDHLSRSATEETH